MSQSIRFEVTGLPPIKRGAESMWSKQVARLLALRMAAGACEHTPATLGDSVHLELVVWAAPTEGDLDGFVAGICDGLQPAHPNLRNWLRAEDWLDLPAIARPEHALGFADDRAISRITAERRTPDGDRRYEVSVSW